MRDLLCVCVCVCVCVCFLSFFCVCGVGGGRETQILMPLSMYVNVVYGPRYM